MGHQNYHSSQPLRPLIASNLQLSSTFFNSLYFFYSVFNLFSEFCVKDGTWIKTEGTDGMVVASAAEVLCPGFEELLGPLIYRVRK